MVWASYCIPMYPFAWWIVWIIAAGGVLYLSLGSTGNCNCSCWYCHACGLSACSQVSIGVAWIARKLQIEKCWALHVLQVRFSQSSDEPNVSGLSRNGSIWRASSVGAWRLGLVLLPSRLHATLIVLPCWTLSLYSIAGLFWKRSTSTAETIPIS